MRALSDNKNVLLSSILLSLLFAVLSFFFKRSRWGVGILLGAAVGMLNFYFLFQSFNQVYRHVYQPDAERASASGRHQGLGQWGMTVKFFARYLFLALAFFLAFKIRWIHFLSFVFGFFIVHLSLGLASLIRVLRSAGR